MILINCGPKNIKLTKDLDLAEENIPLQSPEAERSQEFFLQLAMVDYNPNKSACDDVDVFFNHVTTIWNDSAIQRCTQMMDF